MRGKGENGELGRFFKIFLLDFPHFSNLHQFPFFLLLFQTLKCYGFFIFMFGRIPPEVC